MNARPDRLASHPADLPRPQALVPGVRICLCDDMGTVTRCVDLPLTAFGPTSPGAVASAALLE